jgi:hypothetical protein
MIMGTHLFATNLAGSPATEPRFNHFAYLIKVSTSATASFVDSMRIGRGLHLKPRERRRPAPRRRTAAARGSLGRALALGRCHKHTVPLATKSFFLTEIPFQSRGLSLYPFFLPFETNGFFTTSLAKSATGSANAATSCAVSATSKRFIEAAPFGN